LPQQSLSVSGLSIHGLTNLCLIWKGKCWEAEARFSGGVAARSSSSPSITSRLPDSILISRLATRQGFMAYAAESRLMIYMTEGVIASFEIGEYWDPRVQIDIVGFRRDNWTDLGECKWGNAVFSLSPSKPRRLGSRPAYNCIPWKTYTPSMMVLALPSDRAPLLEFDACREDTYCPHWC